MPFERSPAIPTPVLVPTEQQETLLRQLDNIKLADFLWRTRVKPEQVSTMLMEWRCGTQACFGGHLCTWPEFRSRGVGDILGIPCLVNRPFGSWRTGPEEVSYHLFGDREIFAPAMTAQSAYDAVIRRLHHVYIDRLTDLANTGWPVQ